MNSIESFCQGLEILCEEPYLTDNTNLSPHQVDALSGVYSGLKEGEYRQWFEHATGSGKSVAALGLIDANRRGKTLFLTHRKALVKQFADEAQDRGYASFLEQGKLEINTYQWFVRQDPDTLKSFNMILCDEAHTALGEKTSQMIQEFEGVIWIGMTATGQLLSKSVSDLFPYQASSFDLATAAYHKVIVPLRCVRVAPGPYVNSIHSVPLRKTGSDIEFDQGELSELLDQAPFNFAAADYYKATFGDLPGVVYAAGVQHAENVAEAFCNVGLKAKAVSGQTPDKQLEKILADYNQGELNVLVNAQLLIEGWNSPRATVCMHLAPTASRRVYQQRIGRVTRKNFKKETGVVVDFVHPCTTHDHPIVTLHSLTARDFYRPGAIVVGQIFNNSKSPVKVEKYLVPVSENDYQRRVVLENNWERVNVSLLSDKDLELWLEKTAQDITPVSFKQIMFQLKKQPEIKVKLLLKLVEAKKVLELTTKNCAYIQMTEEQENSMFEIISGWDKKEAFMFSKSLLSYWSKTDAHLSSIWQAANYGRVWYEKETCSAWKEFNKVISQVTNNSSTHYHKSFTQALKKIMSQNLEIQVGALATLVPFDSQATEMLEEAKFKVKTDNKNLAKILFKLLPRHNHIHERVGYEPNEIAVARRELLENIEDFPAIKSVFSKVSEEGWVLTIKLHPEHSSEDIPSQWQGIPLEVY